MKSQLVFVLWSVVVLCCSNGFTQEQALEQDSLSANVISSDTVKHENASSLNLVDITESWSQYQPATLDPINWRPVGPNSDTLKNLLKTDIALFNQNRLDPTIDSLLFRLKADTLDYVLHNLVGIKYGKVGYLDEAKAHFLRAIGINSLFYKATNNLGNVYFKEGEFERAYEQYRKSADLDPQNPDVLLNWAYAALELGKTNEATELEARSFELNQHQENRQSFRVITETQSGIAMKASEGTASTLEPIWIE